MRLSLASILFFLSFSSIAQKAITNEISADLRFGAGLTNSKLYHTGNNLQTLSFPCVSLYYTPLLYKSVEMQIGFGGDARGGKTRSPFAKFRGYNVNAMVGIRHRLKDFKYGLGINPVYFIDTRKTVLEGSLSSGVVHIPVKHFRGNDLPVYASAELKIHEKIALELRYSLSIDAFADKTKPAYSTISFTANYLLAYRYKRVKIGK